MKDEESQEHEYESCSLDEHCAWCNSTGDIKKNNRFYWGAVIVIVVFLALMYILAVRG